MQKFSSPAPSTKAGPPGIHLIRGILILFCLIIISACSNARQLPPEESGYAALNRQLGQEQRHLQQARQQQEDMLEDTRHRHYQHEVKSVAPLIPEFNPLQESVVSISVNNRPLHDILFVIARNAGLNLVVAPEVSLDYRVTISFDQTPAGVVVDRLLDAYDLDWTVKDNVLFVRPFVEEIFYLDFLDSNTRVSVDSGGNIFGQRGTDARTRDNSSSGDHNLRGNFAMTSSFGGADSENSIYGFLKTNLGEILTDQSGESHGHFVLDPTAGTLYVRSSPRKMRVARQFINKLQEKLSQQVIIDAQILEVVLSDSFQLGVDWSYISQHLASSFAYSINLGWQSGQGFGTYGLESPEPVPIVIDSRTSDVNEVFHHFSTTIQALETFGRVHVVSNPHVRTRHLQPALVTSGTTRNYIQEITRSRRTSSDDDWVDFSVNTATAFEGVMLGVVPFITDSGDVDLNIFPITSQVDLSRTTEIGGDQITLPTVNVRNVNTNVRIRDGDTVILGGLIQKSSRDRDRATPGVSRVPALGWLFKQRSDSRDLSELVVIMHVRVVSP